MNLMKVVAVLFCITGWATASFAVSIEDQFVPSSVSSLQGFTLEQRQTEASLFKSYPEMANVYVRVAKGGSWGSKWYAVGLKSEKESVVARFPAGQYTNVQLAPGDWDMGVFYKQKKVKENLFKTQPISSRFDLNLKAGAVVLIDCYEPGAFPDADRDTGSVLQSFATCNQDELKTSSGVTACSKPYSVESNQMSRSKLIKAKQAIGSCRVVTDQNIFRQSTLAKSAPYFINQDYIYQKAQVLNTVEAFQYYIDAYPNGAHVAVSKQGMKNIEDKAYRKTQGLNTAAAYQTFLASYPNSPHAHVINSKIKELQQSEQVTVFLQRYKSLPLQVKKDKIMIMLTNQLKQQQYAKTFLYFEALQRLNIHLSPSFAYFWGEALVKTEQYKKGMDKLYAYIKQVGASGKYYAMALALSNEAEAKLEVERVMQFSEFVAIPSGSFIMGSDNGDSDEKPKHRVRVSSFKMGKYEVTQAQWQAVMGSNPSKFKGANRPVEQVSWDDIQIFISKLNSTTGRQFRLPTEAEWEYAARAGSSSKYPWGNTASHSYANYGADDCCEGYASGRDEWVNTSPVGSFPANNFGLYDMHGNVWEWVHDVYHDSYNGAPSDGSAWEGGSKRVLRGGSWLNLQNYIRSANRSRNSTDIRYINHGFRLAQD